MKLTSFQRKASGFGPLDGVKAVRAVRSVGFTLLQLVVLLSIVAAVAMISIQSTSRSINQSRFQATVQLVSDIRTAMTGLPPIPPSQPSAVTSCFVADMGRLPRARTTTSDGTTWLTVDELFTRGSLLPYANYSPTEANTVLYWDPSSTDGGKVASNKGNATNVLFVPCGWRGPYVSMNPLSAYPVDGWGKPLWARASSTGTGVDFFQFSGTGYLRASTNRAEIAGIEVTGGLGVEASINAEDDAFLGTHSAMISSNEITADITVTVNVSPLTTSRGNLPPKNNWFVDLRIFGPNPDADKDPTKPLQCVIKRVPYDSVTIRTRTSRLLIGPKVIIAEIVNNGGNTPGGLGYVTYPVMVNVLAGGNNFSNTGVSVD